MNTDLKKLEKTINLALKKLSVELKKKDEDYLEPLNSDTIGLIIDFLKKIFRIDSDKRYNTKQLKRHLLLKILD